MGTFSGLLGHVSRRLPPPAGREEFAVQVRDALAGHEPFHRAHLVSLQFGHIT
jgi:hypothetical protein